MQDAGGNFIDLQDDADPGLAQHHVPIDFVPIDTVMMANAEAMRQPITNIVDEAQNVHNNILIGICKTNVAALERWVRDRRMFKVSADEAQFKAQQEIRRLYDLGRIPREQVRHHDLGCNCDLNLTYTARLQQVQYDLACSCARC